MQPKQEDRRVRNTKAALQQSLIALLAKKPLAAITTSELCRHAKINRNTFYAHYASPTALLNSMEQQLQQQFMRPIQHIKTHQELFDALCEVCRLVYNNRLVCAAIFSPNGDEQFMVRTLQHVRTVVAQQLQTTARKQDPAQLNFLCDFLVGGYTAAIRRWTISDDPTPPEQVAKMLAEMYYKLVPENK